MPAEAAHQLGFALIRCAAAMPSCVWLLRRWLAPRDPVLRVHAFGRELPGPLGLAAGFDKDAVGVRALGALGFAFVEVGTVTAEPQPGNPKPRLIRLPADRALINRMGFNNHGAAAAAARLPSRPESGRRVMVGANIGKTKVTRQSAAAVDYAHSARLVAPGADYLVINVSSPNTPGLRDLQAVSELRALIAAVHGALQSVGRSKIPLLVKIAPDLADEDIDAVADLALELGLAGIIATNTTVSRDHLTSSAAEIAAAGAGGLSGPPLRPRALHVLRRLRARVGDRLVLVAAGGIDTPDDAWERIRAGATLLQGYTGFIYGGPLWPHRVHCGLARRAHEAGFASVQDAVGTSALAASPQRVRVLRAQRVKTQNSLPSGSASTCHSISSSGSRNTVAPASRSGITSGAVTSQWTRFFTVFGSGTGTKSMVRIGMPGTPSSVNHCSLSVTVMP
jgi:dihydroorotate dehydrogenase